MSDWLPLLAFGALAVAVMMFALWLIHLAIGNAAIVDVGWAFGLALLGVGYAMFGPGWEGRRAALGLMASVWGVRLGLYLLLTRVIGHEEEGRYKELRRRWKTALPAKFLAFFEVQALLDVLLSLPFVAAACNKTEGFSSFEFAGMGLWFIALIGEIVADGQLAGFKRRPENRGHTCQAGLWHYSRHPNYFFEWLIWVAWALFALASPHGYLGLLSPALILYFLLRVTGIPATEEQAVRSRGDEYRRYQQTTSAFVPWLPKTSRATWQW